MLNPLKTWLDARAKAKSDQKHKKDSLVWFSNAHAAAEELLDDHDLGVTIPLPAGVTYDGVVSYILTAARNKPSWDDIVNHLTQYFKLEPRDASRAIDRTLGGVVRAAHRKSKFCPNPISDPIAWHSFTKASHDYYFVQDIYHGYTLSDGEGNGVKIKPRLYADFNGIVRLQKGDYLILDGRGTRDDLDRLGLDFKEGLEAVFYDDDAEDDGTKNDIQADGTMKYDPEYKWVAVIEWDKIHHASDRKLDE